MKKKIIVLTFFTISFGFCQEGLNSVIKLIEKRITENSMDGFKKLEVDVDDDNDLDYIYLYQCGEPKCVEVYLNKRNRLEKVISEFCYIYYLYEDNGKKSITIPQTHCCGESPFTSFRTFNFTKDDIQLKDNYVLFNESYELLNPKVFLETSYYIKTINNDYNVRFSPNIRKYTQEESMFSCQPNTNIIGKLKKNSRLKVLSTLIKPNRTWLFVEIESKHLNTTICYSPIDYGFKNQKLRAWISNKYTKKD